MIIDNKAHIISEKEHIIITPAISLCIFFGVLSNVHRQSLVQLWEHLLPIYKDKLQWYLTERMRYKEPVDQDVLKMIPTWFEQTSQTRRCYLYFCHGGVDINSVSPWTVELYIENTTEIEESQKPFLSAIFEVPEDDLGKQANCFRLSFPLDSENFSLQDFLSICKFVYNRLPFIHGYGGYSLLFDTISDSLSNKNWTYIKKIAMRHPGYDIFVYDSIKDFVFTKLKTVSWVTLLGKELTEQFVQMKRANFLRSHEIEIVESEDKMFIQAGVRPQIGDSNRNDNLPLYQQVAKALSPFICEYHYPFSRVFDEDKTLRWIKRFRNDE